MSVSRNFSNNFKEKFPNHKRKHNMSLKLWHEVNTKELEYFLVDNKQELCYYSKPSADGLKKIEFKYLKSMNLFLLSLVIFCVGSWFKVLRMSWYKCMTPFLDSLQLVIKNYLCHWLASFPGIDYNSNKQVLSGISK